MNDIESPALARVREAVTPIVSDLGLDLYDLEQRGGIVHITIDTPPGSGSGVTIESLSLVHRLLDKQLDQEGDLLTKFGLEVSSPGVERSLRRPEHFRREVGKVVAIRLSDVESADRRIQGELVAADDAGVTVRLDTGDRSVAYTQIDRARTVFEWGPTPKPGHGPKKAQTTPAAQPAEEASEGDVPQ
jgi:ribosome maturation factor RimP